MRAHDPDPATVEEVARLLARSASALFITGAGLSADSGLPTYRGIGGLYEGGLTEDGITIEEALSGAMLRRAPERTWKHIYRIEEACRGAKANAGHEAIAALERCMHRVWVLTQNVDGFHQSAGSKNVIELHGNLHHLACTRCGHETLVEGYAGYEEHVPPTCERCGGLVRPQVVLFGEMLPQDALGVLYRELGHGFDVILSVGTSAAFPYISQPVVEASRLGLPSVEINPGQSEISPLFTHRITARAAPALSAVLAAYQRLT